MIMLFSRIRARFLRLYFFAFRSGAPNFWRRPCGVKPWTADVLLFVAVMPQPASLHVESRRHCRWEERKPLLFFVMSLLLSAIVPNSASGHGSHQGELRCPSSMSPPPRQLPPDPTQSPDTAIRICWRVQGSEGEVVPFSCGASETCFSAMVSAQWRRSFLKHHDASGQDNCVHMLTSHGIKWASWAAVSLPYLKILKTKTASSEWHKLTACWLAQFLCCFLDSLGCQMFDKKYLFWPTNLIFTFTMTRSLMIRYENRR